MVPLDSSAPASAAAGEKGPVLVPLLYLDSGQVMEHQSGDFVPLRGEDGKTADPFDVADRLVSGYRRFCVVDLEGLRRNRPQLDYLQELSRSGELWVDAGVRTGDQVIDVLVTGARRAVLSTAFLLGTKQLRRAWRLSTELLFAVETEGAGVRSRGNDWDGTAVTDAVANARSVGIVDVVLRARQAPVDWSLVRQLSTGGPTWVEGPDGLASVERVTSAGATGGLFDAPRALLLGTETP